MCGNFNLIFALVNFVCRWSLFWRSLWIDVLKRIQSLIWLLCLVALMLFFRLSSIPLVGIFCSSLYFCGIVGSIGPWELKHTCACYDAFLFFLIRVYFICTICCHLLVVGFFLNNSLETCLDFGVHVHEDWSISLIRAEMGLLWLNNLSFPF